MARNGNGESIKDARRKFVEDFLAKWQKGSNGPGASKVSKMLEDQEEILKEDPTNHRLWFARGTLLAKVENHEDAIKCFDVAIKLRPDYKEAWNAKADSLSSINKHEDAARCYKNALESISTTRFETIDIFEEENAVKGIIKEIDLENKQKSLLSELENLDNELKVDPKNVDAWYSKAIVLIRLNDHFKAMECLHEVTKLDLKHPKVWKTKGDLFRKLGDHKKASMCYKRAQEFMDDAVPCPLCGEFVSAKETRCPECGIRFDDSTSEISGKGGMVDKAKGAFAEKAQKHRIPAPAPPIRPTIEHPKPEPPSPKPVPRPPLLSRRAGAFTNGNIRAVPEPKRTGLTNGMMALPSVPGGTGKVNGFVSNPTKTHGMRDFSRDGAVNGLTNGLRRARAGLTNGLTNGMGLTNGLGYPNFFRDSARSKWKIYIVPLVSIMLMVTPLLLQTNETASYDIMIDGDFADWNGKTFSVGDDPQLNPGIDVVEVGIENNKDYLAFYVETRSTMMAGNPGNEGLDTIFIFIDYDRNVGTGYRINSIGADNLVMISGDGSGIKESVLREFGGVMDNNDWNGWRTIANLEFARDSSRLETQVRWEALGDAEAEVDVFLYSMGHDMEQDLSDYIVSNQRGILDIEISSAASEVLSGNNVPLLDIHLEAINSDIEVDEMSFELIGTAGPYELSNLLLVDMADSGILDQKIPIGSDVAFRFGESLHIAEGTAMDLQLRVDLKEATGNTIGATIGSSRSVITDRGTVNLAIKPSIHELGYNGIIPGAPVIDGAFSEWKASAIDFDSELEDARDIDIRAYNVSVDANNAYFYVKVDGSLMNGTMVPFRNRINAPVQPEPSVADDDRDSIPDSGDPFKGDFNNNGNPDSDSPNDIDEDGLLEYPMGNDWWLNTTIPNSTAIPLEYRGKTVSIYIGPIDIPPVLGEDAIRIYLETTGNPGNGYIVGNPLSGNMYADYLIEIKGKNGNILSKDLLRFNGNNPGNWQWELVMSVEELEKDRSQVEGSIDLSLSGISSLSYAFIEVTDWHLNIDETQGRESVKSAAGEATKATSLSELVSGVGNAGGDRFGWNVSYAGDVNNDGYPDIIVGAPYNDTVNGAPADWWDTDWKYRKNLTFVNEDQSESFRNFTVMVKLNSQNFDYTKAKNDGTDLRFIDEDGSTSLKYHIEDWDSSGSSIVWVNVTEIDASTSTDYMHMYYGNSGASDIQDVEGTYDNNFSAVWHLNETSSTHYDSTSNNNDGSPQGGVTQDATGWMDGGDSFDGSNDYIDCGNDDSLNITDQITLEAWAKPIGIDHAKTDLSAVGKWDSSKRSYVLYLNDDSGDVDDWEFKLSNTGSTTDANPRGGDLALKDMWQYVVGTWDGTTARIYLNGAQVGSDVSFSGPIYESDEDVWIGNTSLYDEFEGFLDEVRISNIGRSGEWVRAQYLSMTDNLIVYGTEEDILNTGAAYIFFGYPGIGSSDIDASNANVTIYGEDAGDLFGWSVSDLGNVDSDAKDDVIIGAPGAGAGKAYIFYGRSSWSSTYDASSADVEIAGEDTGHRFGASVSRAGDVDNGNYNDIVVGAHNYGGASWWDSDWTYRKKLTFDNSAQTESLDNFTVLVNLSASNFDYTNANSDGSDLRFVDADDSTELNFHIENYTTSGTSNLWVNVTKIDGSSSTDYIWMYYGNSEAADAQNFHGTYDGNFSGVWHLNETSGWIHDSTSKGNVGIPTKNVTQDTPGIIDGADYFDGTYDRITISNHSSMNPPNDMTLEAWVNVAVLSSTLGRTQTFVAKRHTSSPYQSFELYLSSGDSLRFGWTNSTGPNEYSGWNGLLALNTWYYLVGVKDGDTVRFYLNGGTTGTFTATASGTMLQSNLGMRIGDDESEEVNGTIDEVRLSNSARSADWIAAQYLSMTDAFITYGSEEVGKTGRAYVFYGDGSIPTSAGSADKTFTGEGAGDMFGFSVSNAGDVDNDGKDDVLIGAPFNDDAGTDAGEAYIFVGGDQYRYASSNVTTFGYMTDFNDSKSASDSGAYAVLKEEDTGGSGGNEYLYVDGLGTERQGWTESGSTPFLDAVEGTNVITTSTNNAQHGDFTFSDSSVSGAFSSSQIELYSYQEGSGESVEVFMYNGTSWQSMGTITPDGSYSWKTLSTSSFLDSKAKVDAAKMYVRYGKSGGPDNVHVDAARIYWSAASETIYRMDIEFNTTNVPSGSNYYLELNYSVDGTETDFGVLVYDSSTWDDMTAQGDLDQTSFTTKSYTLDPDHRLGSGYVRVRYIGRNETSDAANSTLNIEYHRIRISGVYLTFSGESTNDNFGWSVANASDINEDGSYDDIIIGAPGYSSSTGRAYIFNGASSMDSIADITLTGETSGDKFGFSVHGVGDVDLDGAPDVVVGAPYYHNGATADAGIIYVYSGGSSMDTTYDYFFKGTQANQHLGWSVGFALKLDGGSYSAIIAGSPDYDDGADTDAGTAKALVMIPEYSTVFAPLLIIVLLFAFRRRRKNGKRA